MSTPEITSLLLVATLGWAMHSRLLFRYINLKHGRNATAEEVGFRLLFSSLVGWTITAALAVITIYWLVQHLRIGLI